MATQFTQCCICKKKYEPGQVVYREPGKYDHVCSVKCRNEYDANRAQKEVFPVWDTMTFMSEAFRAVNCTLKKVTVDTKEATPAPQAVIDLPGTGISIDALTKYSGQVVTLVLSRDWLKLKKKGEKKPEKKPVPPVKAPPPLDPSKRVT